MNNSQKFCKTGEIYPVQLQVNVIGVGGGGANVVNHFQIRGAQNMSLSVCDTDASVIERANVKRKLLLAQDEFLATLSPEIVRMNDDNLSDIRSLMNNNADVTVVVACLGGGCGSKVAQFIAGESKRQGKKTIGVVTLPFDFEGPRRLNHAFAGLKTLAQNTDAIFVLNNQNIFGHHQDLDLNAAFSKSDELVYKFVTELVDDF